MVAVAASSASALIVVVDPLSTHIPPPPVPQAGASDKSLVTALQTNFGGHASYSKPRFGADISFCIGHFGGQVASITLYFFKNNRKKTQSAITPSRLPRRNLPQTINLSKFRCRRYILHRPLWRAGTQLYHLNYTNSTIQTQLCNAMVT